MPGAGPPPLPAAPAVGFGGAGAQVPSAGAVTAFQPSQVTVQGPNPVPILSGANRARVALRNLGPFPVWIGSANVAPYRGTRIGVGEEVVLMDTAPVYASALTTTVGTTRGSTVELSVEA